MTDPKIKIIYEDRDILAVNKPAGILAHATEKSGDEFTLADWIAEKYPALKTIGDEPEQRPGIVHRLDRDTSGAMVIAKTQSAFKHLKRQFQERNIIKKYIALITGSIKNDEGEINLPVGRSKKDPTKRIAIGEMRGKREALTRYKTLERFSGYTLMEAEPKTGRTHQIRAHFKALGHPVACDKLYGGKRPLCPEGLFRQFLHAASLELALPSGARVKIEAELPEDLTKTLKNLRK